MIMKLTYWVAEDEYEPAYSIIGKTKKEVIAKLKSKREPEKYSPVEKKVIIYADAFELLDLLTGEMGGRTFYNAE